VKLAGLACANSSPCRSKSAVRQPVNAGEAHDRAWQSPDRGAELRAVVRQRLILLLLILPVGLQAQFTFMTNDGTLTITGYTGPGGEVTIPSNTNGWPVTIIGNSAFYNCTNLDGITIPSSVTNIGDYAFSYCYSLTNIAVPDSVTSMGDWVFLYCTNLANITIPNSLTSIGTAAFENCLSLTSITLPKSVTNIGDFAFLNCCYLTSVAISDSVTRIGAYAFFYCTSMISFTIPNSVTSIGEAAFAKCSTLISVTIPNRVTNIGPAAFVSCTNLTAITVDASNPVYGSVAGVLFDKTQTTLIQYPGGILGSYAIPNGVATIGENAFFNCTKLTSVTIPSSVTSIGNNAFPYCTSLAYLYFKGNAPIIDSTVFYDDTAVVYYLPGTTGWGLPFGGLSTLLWNPLVQTTNADFGVLNNEFGFTITGTANIPIVVETSTNLTSANWASLQICTLTNGSIYFSDPIWTNYPNRFYRIRSP
jgi:hypothetical protein